VCSSGGGEGEGEKGHDRNRSPRHSVVHLFFVVVAQRIFSDIFFRGLKNIGGKLTCWTP
jgi:hypothetical protein